MDGMSQGTNRVSGVFVFAVYLFLFSLFFWPVVDLFSNTWPLQPGNIQWRIGFMGLFTAYLTTPLLAIVLAMALAFVLGHKAALRLLSVFCFLGLVVITVAIGLFALDAIQLRSGVPDENRSAFTTGSILTEFKFLSVLLVLVFLGWGGWKTVGNIPGKPKSSERAERTAEVLKAQKREG
jgi:hypothetical protein